MSTSDIIVRVISPLFRYAASDKDFNKAELDVYAQEIVNVWNAVDFTFKPSSKEVIDYYNSFVSDGAPEDPIYRNSELYMFIRYAIMLCALDSYGPCNSIEDMECALERGTRFIEGGILEHIKRLSVWSDYSSDFNGWNILIEWVLNTKYPTWFTKGIDIHNSSIKNIAGRWKNILRAGFNAT
jgi:hypothetical protein